MNRSSQLKTDPVKARAWQQRSRKPLKRKSGIARPSRSLAPKVGSELNRGILASQGLRGAKRRSISRKPAKTLKAKPDPKLAVWGRAVKDRDGDQCQVQRFSGMGAYWLTSSRCFGPIDPHHIAERSLRPDLKYELSNGIALCRAHHDLVPLNRQDAIRIGLLSDETYEAAQKRKIARAQNAIASNRNQAMTDKRKREVSETPNTARQQVKCAWCGWQGASPVKKILRKAGTDYPLECRQCHAIGLAPLDYCYAKGDEGAEYCGDPQARHHSKAQLMEFRHLSDQQKTEHLVRCMRDDHLIHHEFIGYPVRRLGLGSNEVS